MFKLGSMRKKIERKTTWQDGHNTSTCTLKGNLFIVFAEIRRDSHATAIYFLMYIYITYEPNNTQGQDHITFDNPRGSLSTFNQKKQQNNCQLSSNLLV